ADRNRSHWSTSKTPSYTKSVSWQHHLKALLITALFMEFISVNTASAAEEIHHADSKVDDQVLIAE
ncbi:hypothetical protein R9N50_01430, partial [Escherichia coli]